LKLLLPSENDFSTLLHQKSLESGDFFFLTLLVQYLGSMRILFFLSTFAFMSASVPDQDSQVIYRLVIHPNSSITIAGSTNVNKYKCVIPKYAGRDTLFLTAERGKGAYFKKGLVKLEASRFDCEKNVITKDFAETIQANKHPYITINFISFERVPEFKESE
jgi:hypothetical protein